MPEVNTQRHTERPAVPAQADPTDLYFKRRNAQRMKFVRFLNKGIGRSVWSDNLMITPLFTVSPPGRLFVRTAAAAANFHKLDLGHLTSSIALTDQEAAKPPKGTRKITLVVDT